MRLQSASPPLADITHLANGRFAPETVIFTDHMSAACAVNNDNSELCVVRPQKAAAGNRRRYYRRESKRQSLNL
jgi:hypothetical protein